MSRKFVCLLAVLLAAGISVPVFAGPVDKFVNSVDNAIDDVDDAPRRAKRRVAREDRRVQPPSADMDAHFIKADEYFTTLRPARQTTMDVQISTMLTPPSEATKGQAQFMDSYKGTEFWTASFWKTRIAAPEDLKVGKTVIYWGRYQKSGVYYAPRNQKEARNVSWRMSKITDTSDLFKNEVTVVGNKRIAVDSIRVME